jgi:hypothetical protein
MKQLVSALLLFCSLAVIQANDDFTINLSGLNEVPSNLSSATGSGIASYDPITGDITVNLSFAGLSTPATASHIHLGAAGLNGPVIVSFLSVTPAATSGTINGTFLFPNADLANLLAGDTYFNIHDAEFPGGEIRGQLVPNAPSVPDSGSTLLLLGLSVAALARAARTGRY